MKILWLCNMMLPKISESLSKPGYNSGGWLVGLSNDLLKIDDIELSVCFPITFQNNILEGSVENLNYYGFPKTKNKPTVYDEKIEYYFENIIKKVNPDVIHIFGTEFPHTLAMVKACEKLGILNKVAVNIQGLVWIYERHYYASLPAKAIMSFSLRDLIKNDNIKMQRQDFIKRGRFELEALKKVSHIIGRTDWDKACTEQINPNATYHFCNETLRDEFYKHKWDINNCEKHSIFISQWGYPIKGFHFMLEAMPAILDKYPDAHIYATGENPLQKKSIINNMKQTYFHKYIGKLIKKYHLQDKITFLGSLNEQQMCDRFIKSHVFVSSSTVENESNSVSEAKILGVPVVASFVGGVTNRIDFNIDGLIYQHDAPYMLAHYVCKIFGDDNLALELSQNAIKKAYETHNREINLLTMINIYKEMGEQN